MIEFRTEPSRYRRWHLHHDGEVTFLIMDFDPAAGCASDYELELKSYEFCGRHRSERCSPALALRASGGGCVVVTSGKDNVSPRGANIRMLEAQALDGIVQFDVEPREVV